MTTETSTEATQGDENTNQKPQVTPQQSERDRITANYEKNLLNEIKPVETDTSEHNQNEESKNEDEQENDGLQQQTEIERQEEKQEPQLIKVKIDGEEREVTLEELTRNYQKASTADKRLQQAAEERKRVEAEKQELERLRQLAQPQQPQEPDRLTQLIEIRKEALRQQNVELFEQADAEITKERLKQVQQTVPDQNALVSQIYGQLTAEMQYKSALDKFLEKNKVIADNNMLYNIAMQQLNAVCQDETIETYDQAFSEVERQMQELFNVIAPQQPDIKTDRQALKSTIPNSTGRATARTAPPATAKEETIQDVIAQMKKARGQA